MSEPTVDEKPVLLQFGYISRAHGLEGELIIRTFDPASEVMDQVDTVVARPRSGGERVLTIESIREAPKNDLLVAFDEIRKRHQAEELVGAVLFANRADLGELEPGEYFQGDLLGLPVFDEAGNGLGSIAEVMNSGPIPNLVIRGEGLPEIMVPLIEEYVPTIDMELRRVVVRPLDLGE